MNQIKILGRNNNKLFNDREMTAKYNQLLNAANVAKSTGELKTLRGELSAFKTELVATNNAGMTWGSKFKESVKSYTKFLVVQVWFMPFLIRSEMQQPKQRH